jgi:hypothetical protein
VIDPINWQTVGVAVLLALIAAAVPVTLGALLGSKNANKKLDLEQTSVVFSGTEIQIKTYQDLLNRANEALTKAEALNSDLSGRVKKLEDEKENSTWQITTLRNLFSQVVKRSNITLTLDEQAAFDSTKPIDEVRRFRRPKTG